jgi:hypothetical protein
MKRDVTVITLRQFEAAGGLSGGYSFDFYSRWNFRSWNEPRDERDGVTYDQMLCSLGDA